MRVINDTQDNDQLVVTLSDNTVITCKEVQCVKAPPYIVVPKGTDVMHKTAITAWSRLCVVEDEPWIS